MERAVTTALLLVVSAAGFVIATYFTAVAYRWIRADEKWIPAFCRMEEQTCASIVFTPQARVFGLPNSVLGMVFYAAVLGGTPVGLLDRQPIWLLFIGASVVSVALGLYLAYSLLFVVKVPCKLCFTAHGINMVILVILLLR